MYVQSPISDRVHSERPFVLQDSSDTVDPALINDALHDCTRAISNLRKGPVNVEDAIKIATTDPEKQYDDTDFTGKDSLYWEGAQTSAKQKFDFDSKLESGEYWFERWPKVF